MLQSDRQEAGGAARTARLSGAWWPERVRPEYILFAALCVIGLLIIGNGLILTNYGSELEYFGIEHSRLLPPSNLGAEVERYMIIPEYQILVQNDFERINQTSPYGEDLRTLFGMPLHDAYLIFKPSYWGFLILPPHMALSFHQLFLITAFVAGYTLLFGRFGVSPLLGFCLAAALYFSPFLQFWWHYFLGLSAFLPWLILAAVSRSRILAGVGVFYLSAAWLLTNLYPPLVIPMGLTAAVCVVMLLGWRETLMRGPVLVIAGGLALALVWYYLRDALTAMQNTSYPGDRVVAGGDGTNFLVWWNQFLPTILTQGGRSVTNIEAAEATGAGSVLFIALAVMLDYRNFLAPEQAALRRMLALPVILLLVIWAWMIIPLPSWLGTPILFDRVSPRRLAFGAGALMAIIGAVILARGRFEISWTRIAIVIVIVLVSWLSVSVHRSSAPLLTKATLLDCALIGIIIAQKAYSMLSRQQNLNVVVAGAALVNLTAFGGFYGIVAAQPVFAPGEFAAKASLDRLVEASPDGVLAIAGERVNGSILNGLGYKSFAQAFFVPHPDFLRAYFPDVPDEDFNFAFNRLSVIRLTNDVHLNAPGLGVMVPVDSFAPAEVRQVRLASLSEVPSDIGESGGFEVRRVGDRVQISGWARFENLSEDQVLNIATSAPITDARYYYAASPIPGNQMLGGFVVWADVSGMAPDAVADLAVWSDDPVMGRYRLSGLGQIPAN